MFDRTTWIAVSLSIAGLIAWQWYYASHTLPAMKAEHAAEQVVSASPALPKVALRPAINEVPIPQLTARRQTLDTAKAEYIFASNIGGIESITLFLHLGEQDHSLQLNNLSPSPIGALLEAPGKVVEGFLMRASQNVVVDLFIIGDESSYKPASLNSLTTITFTNSTVN